MAGGRNKGACGGKPKNNGSGKGRGNRKQKMKTNKVWIGCLILVIVLDIIIVITKGAISTLSYFVWSHNHWFIIPFITAEAMGHFFVTKRLNFVTKLGLKRYIILGAFTLIALILTFFIYINPLIPFAIGFLIGGIFWSQVKIK